MFFFPRTYSLNKEGVLYTDEYDLSVNDLLYLEKKGVIVYSNLELQSVILQCKHFKGEQGVAE